MLNIIIVNIKNKKTKKTNNDFISIFISYIKLNKSHQRWACN